jgi:hypothetical protein
MTRDALKTMLRELDITQTDFARLIGVRPRAVTLWLAEERAIPGPVEAYVRLLRLLPLHLRHVELSRLKQKGSGMRDGMFGITFQRQQGTGMGVLICLFRIVISASMGLIFPMTLYESALISSACKPVSLWGHPMSGHCAGCCASGAMMWRNSTTEKSAIC